MMYRQTGDSGYVGRLGSELPSLESCKNKISFNLGYQEMGKTRDSMWNETLSLVLLARELCPYLPLISRVAPLILML